MTVTEAVSYCRNLHNASSDSNWSDVEIYTLLQAKAMEACVLIGLIEGKTTTASVSAQQDYAYPTDFLKIRRVRYNGNPLKYIPFRVFEVRTPSGVSPTGTPREYTLWNNVISLIPIPTVAGDVITIFGEKQQSAITTSASTLDLPVVFHPGLCEGTIGEMFAKDLNQAFAEMYMSKWDKKWIPMMKQFAKQRRRVASPITVTDTESSMETESGVI